MYYCYILQSQKDSSYYIGSTKNLEERFAKHNRKEVPYSSTKTPFKIAWYAAFSTKEKALAFEKYLKTSSGFAFRNKRLV